MSMPVIGIDISKLKVDVALLNAPKIKSKSFKNASEGFQALALWLRNLGIQQVHACMEATGNYGEDPAIIFMRLATWSVLLTPPESKDFPRTS